MILVVLYVVLVSSIHASPQKKVYGQIGLPFALIAAGVLLGDYFVQFSVVPISLMNEQTEGRRSSYPQRTDVGGSLRSFGDCRYLCVDTRRDLLSTVWPGPKARSSLR
jgi:hypothetical protein